MTRLLRAATVTVALLVTEAIAIPEVVHATTFVEMSTDRFTDASTYIVEGKVTAVWTELDPANGFVWTKARVQVTSTLKGPDRPAELVVSVAGGDYGDYSMYVPGMAVFSVDEDVFLFLGERGDRLTPVAGFEGKYTIRRAPGDTEPYVRTWHTSRDDHFDARFLPHPSPENRVYLADLEQQVRDHLALPWDGKPIQGVDPAVLRKVNTPERRAP